MTVRTPTRRRSLPGFYLMLAVVAIAAFIFRLAYDIALKKRFPHPDGIYYLARQSFCETVGVSSIRSGERRLHFIPGMDTRAHDPSISR